MVRKLAAFGFLALFLTVIFYVANASKPAKPAPALITEIAQDNDCRHRVEDEFLPPITIRTPNPSFHPEAFEWGGQIVSFTVSLREGSGRVELHRAQCLFDEYGSVAAVNVD